MAARADTFDLARLSLRSGEGRRLELDVALEPLRFGSDTYAVGPSPVTVTVDVSRLVGGGWSLRLRFEADVSGPCMRCLGAAGPRFAVDAREVDQADSGEELDSPYVTGEVLDLAAWAHDAFSLALPSQIVCGADCPGLCPECGARLADDPGHRHEREPDHRWAALRDLKLT